MENCNKYRIVTVDCVCIYNDKIVLGKRSIDPFKGYWVLPGGKVERNENIYQAVRREVKEELGSDVDIKGIVGIYSDPSRDPRGYISIAFYGVLKQKPENKSEFFEIILIEPEKALELNLGFDHRKILEDFLKIWNRDKE